MRGIRGFTLVLFAAFFWGISATYAKVALVDRVSTVLIVQTRVMFSLVVLTSYFLATNRALLNIRRNDLWRFAMVGVIGVAGSNFLYYFAIQKGTVANAILLQYTAPIMAIAFAVITRQETLTVPKTIGACLSLAGCALVVGGNGVQLHDLSVSAFLGGIASAACFTFFTLATKRLLQRYSVWTVTIYSLLFASAFWIVLNPPWKILQESPSSGTWVALLVFAVVSILLPYSLYFNGLQRIEASRAIIASTFEPIVAIGSAALLLHERLRPIQTLGAACVITAILVVKGKSNRLKPAGTDVEGREPDAAK